MKWISRLILKLLGWKLVGEFPKGRFVVVGAPHTSNWDFFYGRLAFYAFGVKVRYLIKKEWFFWPFSLLFSATGGIPTDRSQSSNFTERLKDEVQKRQNLKLAFAPEGTRSRVDRWKTGFYRVATETDLPILLGFLDYEKKEAGAGGPVYPTGDLEKDLLIMEDFYKDKAPFDAKKFNPEFFQRTADSL